MNQNQQTPAVTGKTYLIYCTGILLLFMLSVTSSWVYYLGSENEFNWTSQLLARFPSFGLWMLLLPAIFHLIRRLMDESGLGGKTIVSFILAGIILSVLHRPLSALITAIISGTATDFVNQFTSASLLRMVAYLLDSFLIYMILAGARIIETVWIMASEKRESELRLTKNLAEARLQTLSIRFQPHFIFNALQGLSMVIYKDPDAADSIIATLSELLRSSSKIADHQTISLSEELELANKYMEIQQLRFGSRIHSQTEVSPDCMNVLCPPFILQPLFENAIKHGVEKQTETTFINLSISKSENNLHIEMSNSIPDNQKKIADGTGFSLIQERLEILYPGQFQFFVKELKSLFKIHLTFPAISKQ